MIGATPVQVPAVPVMTVPFGNARGCAAEIVGTPKLIGQPASTCPAIGDCTETPAGAAMFDAVSWTLIVTLAPVSAAWAV